MKYVTSDTHFGHGNIIKYCDRPFSTIEEMDKTLIDNWNAVVRPEDEVFHHGDLTFHKDVGTLRSILNRLNGSIYFIMGNHDKMVSKNPEIQQRFVWIKDYFELKEAGKHWVMCHFPLLTWHKAHHGSIHTHGHCHGTIDHLNTDTRRIDVGVDPQKYFPVTLENISKRLSGITYKPVDHHGSGKEM